MRELLFIYLVANICAAIYSIDFVETRAFNAEPCFSKLLECDKVRIEEYCHQPNNGTQYALPGMILGCESILIINKKIKELDNG